jgi:hypothetical protein
MSIIITQMLHNPSITASVMSNTPVSWNFITTGHCHRPGSSALKEGSMLSCDLSQYGDYVTGWTTEKSGFNFWQE